MKRVFLCNIILLIYICSASGCSYLPHKKAGFLKSAPEAKTAEKKAIKDATGLAHAEVSGGQGDIEANYFLESHLKQTMPFNEAHPLRQPAIYDDIISTANYDGDLSADGTEPGCESTPEKPVRDDQPDNSAQAKKNEIIAAEKAKKDPQEYLDMALANYEDSQKFWAEDNPEKSIETLDEAYRLILKVDTESNLELGRQVEDLRLMISKRVLEIYASRHRAVSGNYNEIPLVMNEHVKKEIERFQGRERKFFIDS